MPLLKIDDEVVRRFPRHHTALFGPVRLDGQRVDPEILAVLKTRCSQQRQSWSEAPPDAILHWRQVFAAMGARSGARASVDALFRRFLRDGDLPQIGPVVDLYNWLSLACVTPMAAYDADHLASGLTLRVAEAGEAFEPLGAPGTNEPTVPGEIIYADEARVPCRFWNWRDCHRTRIRPGTRSILFVADLTSEICPASESTGDEMAQQLAAALQAPIEVQLLPPHPPEAG